MVSGADVRRIFRDYPMILIRADEPMGYGAFRTALRELLAVLPFRKDRREMRKFIGEQEAYRKLDRDTLEAIAVMTDNRKLEKYFGMSEKRASEYLEHFLQEEGCLSII